MVTQLDFPSPVPAHAQPRQRVPYSDPRQRPPYGDGSGGRRSWTNVEPGAGPEGTDAGAGTNRESRDTRPSPAVRHHRPLSTMPPMPYSREMDSYYHRRRTANAAAGVHTPSYGHAPDPADTRHCHRPTGIDASPDGSRSRSHSRIPPTDPRSDAYRARHPSFGNPSPPFPPHQHARGPLPPYGYRHHHQEQHQHQPAQYHWQQQQQLQQPTSPIRPAADGWYRYEQAQAQPQPQPQPHSPYWNHPASASTPAATAAATATTQPPPPPMSPKPYLPRNEDLQPPLPTTPRRSNYNPASSSEQNQRNTPQTLANWSPQHSPFRRKEPYATFGEGAASVPILSPETPASRKNSRRHRTTAPSDSPSSRPNASADSANDGPQNRYPSTATTARDTSGRSAQESNTKQDDNNRDRNEGSDNEEGALSVLANVSADITETDSKDQDESSRSANQPNSRNEADSKTHRRTVKQEASAEQRDEQPMGKASKTDGTNYVTQRTLAPTSPLLVRRTRSRSVSSPSPADHQTTTPLHDSRKDRVQITPTSTNNGTQSVHPPPGTPAMRYQDFPYAYDSVRRHAPADNLSYWEQQHYSPSSRRRHPFHDTERPGAVRQNAPVLVEHGSFDDSVAPSVSNVAPESPRHPRFNYTPNSYQDQRYHQHYRPPHAATHAGETAQYPAAGLPGQFPHHQHQHHHHHHHHRGNAASHGDYYHQTQEYQASAQHPQEPPATSPPYPHRWPTQPPHHGYASYDDTAAENHWQRLPPPPTYPHPSPYDEPQPPHAHHDTPYPFHYPQPRQGQGQGGPMNPPVPHRPGYLHSNVAPPRPDQNAPYSYMQPSHMEEKTVLRKKFSWKHYPPLERFLIANREEYLKHSQMNYTAEQKQYNNWLTERLLEVAAQNNYEFDPEDFNFVAIRDRIRCYYKSYVQTARKRGLRVFPAKPKAEADA